jgi:formylmethanofuran dehydrogenase subunit C
LRLTLKNVPAIPLEAEQISPGLLRGKSALEVAKTPLLYGNAEVPLGDFFDIRGQHCKDHLHLEGNLSRVKHLARGMNQGLLTIDGPVGMHLGAGMSGGEIRVQGDVGDWLGAQMKGGLISIQGRAGHLVGAAYWGEKRGMTGGTIIIHGQAGNEIGNRMARGLLVVTGDCGDFAGVQMRAGTIIVLGKAGLRPGANMRRGTIILAHSQILLPTFNFCCAYNPPFLPLLARVLEKEGVALSPVQGQLCARYLGDTNELGKGEILLCNQMPVA